MHKQSDQYIFNFTRKQENITPFTNYNPKKKKKEKKENFYKINIFLIFIPNFQAYIFVPYLELKTYICVDCKVLQWDTHGLNMSCHHNWSPMQDWNNNPTLLTHHYKQFCVPDYTLT